MRPPRIAPISVLGVTLWAGCAPVELAGEWVSTGDATLVNQEVSALRLMLRPVEGPSTDLMAYDAQLFYPDIDGQAWGRLEASTTDGALAPLRFHFDGSTETWHKNATGAFEPDAPDLLAEQQGESLSLRWHAHANFDQHLVPFEATLVRAP